MTAVVAGLCLVATLLAAGFGAAVYAGPAADSRLLTSSEVNAAPAGSPGRTVLEWFHAIQTSDQATVYSSLAPTVQHRLGRHSVETAVSSVAAGFGKPAIVSTYVRGGAARVRLWVLGFRQGTSTPVVASPLTLTLTRIAGRWRMADARYLMALARAVRAARP
jgi:hypothetical protein